MKTLLWQSEDGYVRAYDDVYMPEETTPDDKGDLNDIFLDGAWIVIWRSTGRWHITRNRRFAKPGLNMLRRNMQQNEYSYPEFWIAPNDAHGHICSEESSDPDNAMLLAQALYAAWEKLAANELPAKMQFLQAAGRSSEIKGWLRPGMALYNAQHDKISALLAEIDS